MDEKTKVIEKKKNMKVYVVAGAVVLLLAVAIVGLFYYSAVSKPKKELQNQLDLGEKYLVELDYDNAILAYGEAIKMDPRSEKGYLGLAEAYKNKITALENEGNYSEAVACLDEVIPKMEEGFNNTGSDSIEKRLKEFRELEDHFLKKIEKPVVEEAAEEYVLEGILYDLAAAIYDDRYDNAAELMVGEMFFEAVGELDYDECIIINIPSGTIGIYRLKPVEGVLAQDLGEYYVYKGEYENGKRHGDGVWFNASREWYSDTEYKTRYQIAKGVFLNDLPNGRFDVSVKWETDELQEYMICDVENGLINGRALKCDQWSDTPEWREEWLFVDGKITDYYFKEIPGFFDNGGMGYGVIDNEQKRSFILQSEEQREQYLNTQYGIMGFGACVF